MKGTPKQLTSVKIDPELFEEFKLVSIKTKINLQKLVERSIFLYLTDLPYRQTINNQLNTILPNTGSVI